ncbi:T9SS type A sorting domain-containing protein [Bacteroidota bacterium]
MIANDSVKAVVEYGTDITNLKPTFTVSPLATIVDTTAAQDFTNPVEYTVTAEDASSKVWTVVITVEQPLELSIYDIQSESEGASDSPYLGELVKTFGVVTGVGNDGYFLQDSAKAWNGIYVYNNTFTATRGDSITIVGVVSEYQSGTQLQNIEEYTILAAGVTLPDALVLELPEALNEKYEGVLVTINNLECTAGPTSYNEWTFADADDDEITIDDILSYQHTFTIGTMYEVTGVRQTYFGDKITPRDANDINEAPIISGFTMTPQTPTSSDDVDITATIVDDHTAASNLTVGLFYGDAAGLEDTEVTFTEGSTANVFEGTIPASASTVYYKITASDGTMDSELTGSYSITVGINNPDGIVSMNIFPNPSEGLFTLEMNASKAGDFKVEIINIQGQVVYTNEIHQDGFYKDQIDISNEASGIYYIRINDGNSMKVSKIMIQ